MDMKDFIDIYMSVSNSIHDINDSQSCQKARCIIIKIRMRISRSEYISFLILGVYLAII